MNRFVLALFLILFGLVYAAPTIIAFRREHPNRWVIGAVNLIGGMTGFGWVMTLIWSLRAGHISPTGNNGGESGLNVFANDPVQAVITRDKPAQLAELQSLLASGSVTADEFAQLKAEILQQA